MDELQQLFALLGRGGVVFGLRAQGHVATIRRMLAEGRTWAEIGAAIGWDAGTAQDHYELLTHAEKNPE